MKYCIATILILLLFMQTFSKGIWYARYLFNKKYIATTLCENRMKPWKQCKGKCLLVKKMAGEESAPAQGRERQYPGQSQDELFELNGLAKPQIIFTSILLDQPGPTRILSTFQSSIFKPPCVLCGSRA